MEVWYAGTGFTASVSDLFCNRKIKAGDLNVHTIGKASLL